VILQLLKLATRERHAAIESHSVLLNPKLSLSAYRETLTRFLGYYAPLEARLKDALSKYQTDFDYGQRYKSQHLKGDLLALGVAPHVLAAIPQAKALPDLATAAKLFGCLYVLEGATLGGQIITRHLNASLGLTPQSGGSFFSGYGQQTGSRWKEFCAHLSAFAAQADRDVEIVESANATFDSLDRWLYPSTTTKMRITLNEPAEHN
jgi:heme oxygenase